MRAENVRIADAGEPDAVLAGTIDLVEHLGEVQILYVDLPGSAEKFLVKVDGQGVHERGQTVRFAVRKQDLHVGFHAELSRLDA